MPEVDKGDGDEAPSRDQCVGEHLRLCYREICAGKARKSAAEHQGLIARARDVYAHRVSSSRIRPDSPDLQSPRRLEEDVPRDRYEEIGKIGSPIVGEEGLRSTKAGGENHGFGLKSVAKALKKYEGDFQWDYDPEKRRFTMTVMIGQRVSVRESRRMAQDAKC